MNKNKKLIIFIIISILQLGILSFLILKNENVILKGKKYKFKCSPVDPIDLFTGRYVDLNIDNETITVDSTEKYKNNKRGYLTFKIDKEGFAIPDKINLVRPIITKSIKVKYLIQKKNSLKVIYPFDRFYLQEDEAKKVEKLFNTFARKDKVYIVVNVNKGDYVVTDLFFDNISVSEFIKN